MAENSIVLGFGGGATIDGADVLITGGSLTRTLSVPYVRPYSTPYDSSKRMQIRLGDGVYAYSGSVSFDLTVDAASTLINESFLARNYEYEVEINDGELSYKVTNCKTESFSVSATPNALVTGTLNFQTTEDFLDNKLSGQADHIFDEDLELLKYWNTGGVGVESFTFTWTQGLTAMYLNNHSGSDDDRKKPQYLRAGLTDLNFDITVFVESDKDLEDYEYLEFAIGKQKIKIKAETAYESEGFNYGGQNEYGTHTYTLSAFAKDKSSDEVFEITSNQEEQSHG